MGAKYTHYISRPNAIAKINEFLRYASDDDLEHILERLNDNVKYSYGDNENRPCSMGLCNFSIGDESNNR